jgi:hypothetical protein
MKGCFEELLFVHVFLNTRLLLHTDNPFHMAALLLRFLPAHKQPSTCMHFTFPVLVHSKPKPQNVNKKKGALRKYKLPTKQPIMFQVSSSIKDVCACATENAANNCTF